MRLGLDTNTNVTPHLQALPETPVPGSRGLAPGRRAHGRPHLEKTLLCLALLAPAALLAPLTAHAKVRDDSIRFRQSGLMPANIDGASATDWVGVDQTWDYDVRLYAGGWTDSYIWSVIKP